MRKKSWNEEDTGIISNSSQSRVCAMLRFSRKLTLNVAAIHGVLYVVLIITIDEKKCVYQTGPPPLIVLPLPAVSPIKACLRCYPSDLFRLLSALTFVLAIPSSNNGMDLAN